jgi:spermidine synthase
MAAALSPMQERRGGAMSLVCADGLGTGSIICHAAPGEAWTFYEIDRIVVDAARDPALFSFMPECGPDVPVVIGDARLTLADEPDGAFDFLLIDAFSSDSIPAHLMTREAVLLYRSKLAPDGMLVFHISNRYLELEGVLAAIAADVGLEIRSAVTRASPHFSRGDGASGPLTV